MLAVIAKVGPPAASVISEAQPAQVSSCPLPGSEAASDGPSQTLNGLTVVFTGKLILGRDKCESLAKQHGA